MSNEMAEFNDALRRLRDELIRGFRIDRLVDWLGARRRNRVIFVGIYIAMGLVCVVAAVLGLGAWPHG